MFSNHWFRRKGHLKLFSFFEFFIVLFWLFTYITLIELQYWSNMRNTISFIIKIILNSQNKIDCVPHLIFPHTSIYPQYILYKYIFTKRDQNTLKHNASVIIISTTRMGYITKSKSYSFLYTIACVYFYFYQNKTSSDPW